MRTNSRIFGFLSLFLCGLAVTHAEKSSALEQDYPAKPVHIVEPFGLEIDLICWPVPWLEAL
jgi:hypothetical protein